MGRNASTASPASPLCPLPSSLSSQNDALATMNGPSACGQCTISMGDVRLLYFPEPTTVSRDMCASIPAAGISTLVNSPYYSKRAVSNATELPPNVTGPVTAIFEGHTFTSGYAYLSFDSVFARDDCLQDFGKAYTNTFVAVPSADLSSIRGLDGNAPYSFNFADLNSPVPNSAYQGMNVCPCSYIQDDSYHPQLSLPQQVKDLDPAWKNCNMAFWGAWDPPHTLTPASVAAHPTATQKPSSPSPTPASITHAITHPTHIAVTTTPDAPSIQSAEMHNSDEPASAQSIAPAPSPVKDPSNVPFVPPIVNIINSGASAQAPTPIADQAPTPVNDPPASANALAASGPPASQEVPSTPQVSTLPQDPNGGDPAPDFPAAAGYTAAHLVPVVSAVAPSAAAPVASVGGQAVVPIRNPAGGSSPPAVVVGGSTILPGAAPVTIAGTPVSVVSGAVVIDSSSIPIAAPPVDPTNNLAPDIPAGGGAAVPATGAAPGGQAQPSGNLNPAVAPPVIIGGQAYSAPAPGQPVAIGSVTLQPGGAPAAVSGQVVSLGPSNLVVGGSTAALIPPDVPTAPAATFALGNNEYIASSGQPIVIAGSTLSAGGAPATISGHVVSVANSGLAVDGNVVPFSAPTPINAPHAIFTLDGQTYNAPSGSSVVLGSLTLSAGGPAATISGHVVSIAPSGVVLDGSLSAYSGTPASIETGAIFTLDNRLYSVSSGQDLTIGSATIGPGAPAQTISEHLVSLDNSGVVVDGNTVPYSPLIAATSAPTFTLDGAVYTAPRPGQPLVVGSATLTAGGSVATLSNGEIVSVGSGGVVVGSSTIPFQSGPGSEPSPSPFYVDGDIYTAPLSGQSLVLGDATITPGGPAVTLEDGEVISIGSQGVVLRGTSTVPFNTVSSGVPSTDTFTVDGQFYTAPLSGQALTIGSITLSPGGPAGTFADGHTVSIGPSGIVVGGTSTVPFFTGTGANPAAPTFTVDGHVYTAPLSGRDLTMGSITLSPGASAATLPDGEIVSLGANGVVVSGHSGKTTIPYARSDATASPGSSPTRSGPRRTEAVVSTTSGTLPTASVLGSPSGPAQPSDGSSNAPRLALECGGSTVLTFLSLMFLWLVIS
ncbi:MAG: hypothetical protein M1820_010543 [Bogoriella megaspora]|nr:MAG: hypothetical protein M1820_010543 [Bogoriella megaspora]